MVEIECLLRIRHSTMRFMFIMSFGPHKISEVGSILFSILELRKGFEKFIKPYI